MNRNQKLQETPYEEGLRSYGDFKFTNSSNITRCFPLLLIIITFGVYFQNIYHEFTYDDYIRILEDPRIWQWDIRGFVFQEYGNRLPLVVRPLTYMVDYSLFGLSPVGYQLHNLFWHSLCVVLVFALVKKVTQQATFSFFGALIFSIHPIQVEAVSNITNRKELLALAFLLLAFLSYIRFLEEHSSRKWGWFLVAGLSWGFGIASKQVTIIFPLLLAAYEMLLVRREQRFLTKYSLLLLGLIGVASLSLLLYAHYVLDITNFQTSRVLSYTLKGYFGELTYLALIATSARAFWNYVQLLIWPSGLCPNHLVELSTSFLDLRALLAWFGLIAFMIIAFTVSSRWPVFAFGMFWFFICWIPISNWLPSAYILADRYMYIPSVGYIIVLVVLGQSFFGWLLRTLPQRAVVITSILATALIVGHTSITLPYNRHWSTQEALMTYMLQCNPLSPQAYNGLGIYYMNQGLYSKAADNFTRAIELGNLISYNNRGNAYYQMGQYQAALKDYNKAISFIHRGTPAYIIPHDRSQAFNNRGTLFYEMGDYEAALRDYNAAISEANNWGAPYFNRGILHLAQKQYGLAVDEFTFALEKVTDPSPVYNARGLAYEEQSNWTKAREDYLKAISSNPSNGEAFFNLGRVQLHHDELEAAIISYKKAKELGWEKAEAVLKVLRKKGYLKE